MEKFFESILTKYPQPQKDGFETIFPNGKRISGTWAGRLEEWEELVKEELWKEFQNYRYQKT